MSNALERVLGIVLTLAALGIGASAVHREFWPSDAGAGQMNPLAPPEKITEWDKVLSTGIRLGPDSAKIQIAEFTDFQCPFCSRYETTIRQFIARHPNDVSRTIVHYPLEIHEYALPAAKAAECAAAQGALDPMITSLYARQDQFGKRPWASFAAEAGIKDTVTFNRCVAEPAHDARIDSGVALAKRLRVPGTPTLIINGWRFRGGPPDSSLERIRDQLLRGKKPI